MKWSPTTRIEFVPDNDDPAQLWYYEPKPQPLDERFAALQRETTDRRCGPREPVAPPTSGMRAMWTRAGDWTRPR